MKEALIFDIKHFAIHDGDGIRTTVFFKGCPLRCIWCHNPEGLSARSELGFFAHKCTQCGACVDVCPVKEKNSSVAPDSSCTSCGACTHVCPTDARRLYGRRVTPNDILPELIADIPFYRNTGGGVTLSGGECLTYPDFCAELLMLLKNEGIHTAVDTCGCVPRESIDKVLPYTDIFLYDIKAISQEVHLLCTGAGNEKILENFIYIAKNGKPIEVRIPYVPGYNSDEIPAIADFIAKHAPSSAVRLLPYHNYAESKYSALGLECRMPPLIPTDSETERARAIIESFGLRVRK